MNELIPFWVAAFNLIFGIIFGAGWTLFVIYQYGKYKKFKQ